MSNDKLVETLRERFEKWAKSYGLDLATKTAPGYTYRDDKTDAAYDAWCAVHAAEAAQAYIAVPCERCQDPAAPHATCPACNGTGTVLAAATQPQAAEPVEAIGCLSIRRFRGCDSMVNHDFDYFGSLPDGDYRLYTHPQPAQDAKDAARYRWLRTHHDSTRNDWHIRDPDNGVPAIGGLDAAIDVAMAKESGR